MVAQRYMAEYGVDEGDMAAVAIQMREHAMRTDHAIMRTPLTKEAYLASRYVTQPLHLFDLCLVNDGGVCLILSRADMARDGRHVPVSVSGWGESYVQQDKLDALIVKRLHPQFQEAGQQALEMADLPLSAIGHLECYDAATIHLVNHVEGHGFVEPGEALHGFQRGDFGLGGKLPINMSGGMLSGAYMHGWNHVAEITRQLRHAAGDRQIDGLHASMFSLGQTDQVHPIVFTRGGH